MCARAWACMPHGLTQRPQLHGDVHVAMLRAVVHGLLQGLGARPAQPHGPLAAAALARRIAFLHALRQDLLQGQHVRLGLLWLRQELPQDVPAGKGTKEGDAGAPPPGAGSAELPTGASVGTKCSRSSPPRQVGPGLPGTPPPATRARQGKVWGTSPLCHPGTAEKSWALGLSRLCHPV